MEKENVFSTLSLRKAYTKNNPSQSIAYIFALRELLATRTSTYAVISTLIHAECKY